MDRRANDRVGPRLVRQLGRCAVGACACRRARSSRTGCRRARPRPTRTTCGSRIPPTTARRGRRRSLPHHDGTPTEHGFASLFPIGDGFGLVWLDGRAMHPPKPGEGARRRARRAWRRRDERALRALRQELQAARRIRRRCEGLRVLPDHGGGHGGRHHHRVSQSQRRRDSRQLRRAARQRQVDRRRRPVFNDNWKIAACPVNGPSLSANGNAVAMSWFTVKNEQGQAYAAFSQDAGKTFARADSRRRWRHARPRRYGDAAGRIGARDLD